MKGFLLATIMIITIISISFNFVSAQKPSIKANELNEEFQPVYEIVNLNIDLILNDCNKTWIYWEKELPINVIPGGNDPEIREAWAKFIEKVNKARGILRSTIEEYIFYHETIIKAKYGVFSKLELIEYLNKDKYTELENKVIKKYLYYLNNSGSLLITGSKISEIDAAFKEAFEKIKKEKGILIGEYYIADPWSEFIYPLIAGIRVYELNEEKVKILNEYLFPIAKKYEIILVYLDSISYKEIDEKQKELSMKFVFEGHNEYLNLVKSYYGVNLNETGYDISIGMEGRLKLPIPQNATFNKEFVLEAVKLVRKYTGCSVPLEIDFRYTPPIEFEVPKSLLPINPEYTNIFIIITAIVVTLAILSALYIKNNYKKKNRK